MIRESLSGILSSRFRICLTIFFIFNSVCVIMSAIPSDLYDLIQNSVNSPIEEFSIEISGNIIGEGFSGDVLFVTLINKKSGEKQFLVVKQQKYDEKNATQKSSPAFDNEIYFYDTIWRKLQQFYFEATNKRLHIIPECLSTSRTDIKRLALENLKTQGFVTTEITKPFDTDHLEMILKTYGIFHGVCMAFEEKNPEVFLEWVNNIRLGWRKMFKKGTQISNALVYNMTNGKKFFDENTEKHLIGKLEEFEKNGPEIIDKLLNNESVPQVINHGDCWSNNLMFKYDDNGQLQDMRLIDFQIMGSGSPIHDISYSFYGGSSVEDLHRLEHFLKIYHSSLSDTLRAFNLSTETIYPFDTLKEQWKKQCQFGFVMGYMVWKLKFADPRSVHDDITAKEYKPSVLLEDNQDEYKLRIRSLVQHMFDNDFF